MTTNHLLQTQNIVIKPDDFKSMDRQTQAAMITVSALLTWGWILPQIIKIMY